MAVLQGQKPYNLIVILGPTASGKTGLAVELAADLGGEIVSGDSRQVYRGMDLGTGKDLHEFTCRGRTIPYHMIDIVDPGYEYNLFEYQHSFYRVFEDVHRRGSFPILAGGTGLYLESVIEGYDLTRVPPDPRFHRELERYDMEALRKRFLDLDPSLHNTTDLLDKDRLIRAIEIEERSAAAAPGEKAGIPRVRAFVTGVRIERSTLHRRIRARLLERLEKGMVEEVERLHREGLSWEKLDYFGLEYRYVGLHLKGELTYGEMVETLAARIRQFAKRQETWFRRMERRGTVIHWFDHDDYRALKRLVEEHVMGS